MVSYLLHHEILWKGGLATGGRRTMMSSGLRLEQDFARAVVE